MAENKKCSMSYLIIFSPTAARQCEKLKDKKLKERIASALEYLANEPFQGKALKAEFKGCYSYRIGDYRIIYTLLRDRRILSVMRIDHRREVYR